jgi:hypothetical protein
LGSMLPLAQRAAAALRSFASASKDAIGQSRVRGAVVATLSSLSFFFFGLLPLVRWFPPSGRQCFVTVAAKDHASPFFFWGKMHVYTPLVRGCLPPCSVV